MKNFLILSIFILSLVFCISDINAAADIEISQSTPIGTILEESDIRSTQSVWIEMIKNAKKSIDIGSLFWQNEKGKAMEPVVKELLDAAERGVQIRIILDAMFHRLYPHEADDFKGVKHTEVRYLEINKDLGGVQHAKYMVVDNANCYIGSENFSWTELSQVHNIGIRINNTDFAETVLRIFNLDWELCKTGNIVGNRKLLYAKNSKTPVTELRPVTVSSANGEKCSVYPAFSPKILVPPSLDIEIDQFVGLINAAQTEVVMQVMTYLPAKGYGLIGYWPPLDNAFRAAAARGVTVKFIVSNWNNIEPNISYLKSLSLIPNIEVKISSIPEYKNQFIPYTRVEHCKYFVVDNNLSWVGTGNWECTYFEDTRDMAAVVNSTQIAEQLRKIFHKDWNGPYVEKINVTKDYKAPKTN